MSDEGKVARPAEHEEPQDEVEAHRHKSKFAANVEADTEDEGDEVEAHRHKGKIA
jgi:hypothetical protein